MAKRDEVEAALRLLAPNIPAHEFACVCDHAMDSPGLRGAAPGMAAWLSLTAYVRHVFTDYDALLGEGYEPDAARFFVAGDMNAILAGWGVRKRI